MKKKRDSRKDLALWAAFQAPPQVAPGRNYADPFRPIGDVADEVVATVRQRTAAVKRGRNQK
jgi:hypothetical protein